MCHSGAVLISYCSKCLLSQVTKEQLVETKDIQNLCTSDCLRITETLVFLIVNYFEAML